jgi:hypothetical protein
MARLSDTERRQLKQASPDRIPVRLARVVSVLEYIAFATFAARFARVNRPKFISGGEHWKL